MCVCVCVCVCVFACVCLRVRGCLAGRNTKNTRLRLRRANTAARCNYSREPVGSSVSSSGSRLYTRASRSRLTHHRVDSLQPHSPWPRAETLAIQRPRTPLKLLQTLQRRRATTHILRTTIFRQVRTTFRESSYPCSSVGSSSCSSFLWAAIGWCEEGADNCLWRRRWSCRHHHPLPWQRARFRMRMPRSRTRSTMRMTDEREPKERKKNSQKLSKYSTTCIYRDSLSRTSFLIIKCGGFRDPSRSAPYSARAPTRREI